MQSPRTYWLALRDYLVLALILAVINGLLGRSDPGWMSLNPTPWLLPIVLIGVRYGFTAGLTAGLVTVALVLGVRLELLDEAIRESMREHAYYFLGLSLAGAVAGEAGARLSERRHRLYQDTERLREENLRLILQSHLMDETRHQLQQQLALFNAPVCSLDEELRQLFTHEAEAFNDQLLRLLHRTTGISSAAIYDLQGSHLKRMAALHPTQALAETLPLTRTPIAQRAAETGALVTVNAIEDLTTSQPFLAAFPWVDHQHRPCMMLVHDMPLEDFNLQQMARFELIISWASAMASMRRSFQDGGGVRPMSTNKFTMVLAEAFETDRRHGLPSALIRVQLQDNSAFGPLVALLPETAITSILPKQRGIAILLPFMGQSSASILAQTLSRSPALAGTPMPELFVITGHTRVEALWLSLTQEAPAA